jgi:hypothetical protein
MRMLVFLARLFLTAGFLVPNSMFAQSLGTRDLTSDFSVPVEHVSSPSPQTCDNIHSSISDGAPAQKAEEAGPASGLEFSIISVSPPELVIGEDFVAVVRLKNNGPDPVLVPSSSSGEQIATGSDTSQEQYEVADVTFRLASGRNRTPVFLDSSGALFAQPTDKNSYLALNRGNWIDLKIKANVTCGAARCLAEIQPDGSAVLSGWWYQRVLTHRVHGCDEDHGSYKIREINSTPFSVVVKQGEPGSKTPPKSKRSHATTHLS